MLVLARHLNESIMIGDEIEIVVVAVSSDQVKLGIRAPRSVAVHRKEVFEEIQREMKLAAAAKGDAARGAELLKKAFPRPGGGASPQGAPPNSSHHDKDPSRRG